jgi:hypothetical protein
MTAGVRCGLGEMAVERPVTRAAPPDEEETTDMFKKPTAVQPCSYIRFPSLILSTSNCVTKYAEDCQVPKVVVT